MSAASNVKLLSGDNPQIPKGVGNAPVASYIAAVPGWKHGIVRAVDELVVSTIPGVKKAVKWNTPLYGLDGSTWFLSMHCFKTYVRLTFFNGTELDPLPEKSSKVPGVRYHDIGEAQGIDTDRLTAWINQAVLLPGEKL